MIPEFPKFKNLKLDDKEEIEKYTSKFPPYSDFNFVSMWSWDIKKKVQISQIFGNLIVRFTDYLTGEPFYSFFGDNLVNETAEALLDLSKREKIMLKLQLVPADSVKQLNTQNFYILESRDHFDYVYHMPDFHKGAGKKYETQRNMLNRFNKKYSNIQSKLVLLQDAKEDILELSKKWKTRKGKHNEVKLKNELQAIKRIFDFLDDNLVAVCVFHQNKLIAYSINEILKDNHVLCHFAKADTEYSGIYSFLMKKTCELLLPFNKEFLNYEQDLGLPNLRFSKSAFKPKAFLTKFTIAKI